MKLLDIIEKRKSIRKYKGIPIPDDALCRILEAARLSPSGKNLQPWRFILVQDPGMRSALARAAANQQFVAQAPVVIVACGFPDECYARMGRYMKSWPVDVAIAMEHLMLQATEEGLGTCWIGAFEEQEVKSLLGIPDNVKVLALTPLGYPDEEPSSRGRKSLEEIISREKF